MHSKDTGMEEQWFHQESTETETSGQATAGSKVSLLPDGHGRCELGHRGERLGTENICSRWAQQAYYMLGCIGSDRKFFAHLFHTDLSGGHDFTHREGSPVHSFAMGVQREQV